MPLTPLPASPRLSFSLELTVLASLLTVLAPLHTGARLPAPLALITFLLPRFAICFLWTEQTKQSTSQSPAKSATAAPPSPNKREPGHLHFPSSVLDIFFPGALVPSSGDFTSCGRHCCWPFELGCALKLHLCPSPIACSTAPQKPPRPGLAPAAMPGCRTRITRHSHTQIP
ncbi:unnamed protein product [Urochloa humidicola]